MNEFLDGPTKLRKNMICICIDDLGEGILGYALMIFMSFLCCYLCSAWKTAGPLKSDQGKSGTAERSLFCQPRFLVFEPSHDRDQGQRYPEHQHAQTCRQSTWELNYKSSSTRLTSLSDVFVYADALLRLCRRSEDGLDNAIHWINLYPLYSTVGFPNAFMLDSDLSGR